MGQLPGAAEDPGESGSQGRDRPEGGCGPTRARNWGGIDTYTQTDIASRREAVTLLEMALKESGDTGVQ